MRGDLYDGWTVLAGDFPASLNTTDDPSKLEVHESPSCYGTNCQVDGYLKAGSCPTGSARLTDSYTIGSTTYYRYYNRLWRFTSKSIIYGAPEYTAIYLPQDLGSMTSDANVINLMPCFANDMWAVTATGSHIIRNADDYLGRFNIGKFIQEFYASSSTNALTLNGVPTVVNSTGVYQFNGTEIVELTRKARYSLGPFDSGTITANYSYGQVIAASRFVVDAQTKKLFDYRTSGFLFTSRTLANAPEFAPFRTQYIRFVYTLTGSEQGRISWQSQSEDNDWKEEDEIVINPSSQVQSSIEREVLNSVQTANKFSMRITALSSNLSIRSIMVCVQGLAIGSFGE